MAGGNSKEPIFSWSLSPGKVPGVERERNQVFKMLLNSHSVKAAMSEKVQEVFSNGESNGDSPSFQLNIPMPNQRCLVM